MLESNQREQRAHQVNEFLRALKKAAEFFRWYVDEFGQIRGEHPDYAWPCCPLTAIGMVEHGKPYRLTDGHQIADELGLADVSFRIYDATDHRTKGRLLRDQILRAVGLPLET